MRELSIEDHDRLDALHLQVRREADLSLQIELINQIVEIIGYPRVNPRGRFAKQLVRFVCSGTDDESTWAGSQVRERMEAKAINTPALGSSPSGRD
jgi:hypothetical protein